jgi:hypothetical protein
VMCVDVGLCVSVHNCESKSKCEYYKCARFHEPFERKHECERLCRSLC